MVLANSRNGEKWKKGQRGAGDGVFLPSAELVVERARCEHRRLGLFIGRLGRCHGGEIFLVAILIHHVATPLTFSAHIAMAGACS
jgi:hypothetical protein